MTQEERAHAVASLEARAEVAERAGLPETAKSWHTAIKTLQLRHE